LRNYKSTKVDAISLYITGENMDTKLDECSGSTIIIILQDQIMPQLYRSRFDFIIKLTITLFQLKSAASVAVFLQRQ